jgi:type IV pilus assembly protein PilB
MDEVSHIEVATNLQQLISANQAWHYSIVPASESNDEIAFYTPNNGSSADILDELEIYFGKKIKLIPVEKELINKTLSVYYRRSDKKKTSDNIHFDLSLSDDFLVNLISQANSIGSSDIHIEIYEEKCRIRMRIDGKLIERYVLNHDEYPALINKIKIKANLDISEKRLPQDGRIYFQHDNSKFDIRVSVLPGLYGEKVVMRLLSKDSTNIEIASLGFSEKQLADYLEGIKQPHGIILISGPTGSGKTTTLYATLKVLNKEEVNIVTIEDPIEYTLDGINQVQMREDIGLTFASALRTFLRQDPDIIMLGEIRDNETAQMAVRAALTGHLVLSTIHTNSAWHTISRLIDMEVPSFLAASTLNLTVAQRLVRLLCTHCKKETKFNDESFPPGYHPAKKITRHFIPVGCETCYYTGYKGRRAVYEVVPIDNELFEHIKNIKLDMADRLREKKIKLLSDSAFELFEAGLTSIEEIYPLLLSHQ